MHPTIRLLALSGALFLSACNLDTGTMESDEAAGNPNLLSGEVVKTSVLAFGDSLTSGGGKISDPWPGQLARMTGRPVISSGAGGETLPRGAARFPGVFNRNNPGVVVIMEGTNDAAAGTSTSEAEAALESMVVYAKSKGARVIVATVPPFQKGSASGDPRVVDINARIKAVASRQGISLADVYSAFGSNGALTQGDGVHLSNEGSAVVAATIADQL